MPGLSDQRFVFPPVPEKLDNRIIQQSFDQPGPATGGLRGVAQGVNEARFQAAGGGAIDQRIQERQLNEAPQIVRERLGLVNPSVRGLRRVALSMPPRLGR